MAKQRTVCKGMCQEENKFRGVGRKKVSKRGIESKIICYKMK